MKVNANSPSPIPSPQGGPAAPQNSLVDNIMARDNLAIENKEARRQSEITKKEAFSSVDGMLSELGSAAREMKLPSQFTKLKATSSHPELVKSDLIGAAEKGSYEFEVKNTAQAPKFLEAGFSDADQSPVGFGYMAVEGMDGETAEITIRPGSTLNDAADQINQSGSGMRANVIDTGIGEEPYRLMVASEKTGKAANINIDPDTTFLNMETLKEGKNLALKFDDVDIERSSNEVKDLVKGLKLDFSGAAAGTKVKVDVSHDVDLTKESIKNFTDKYNKIIDFSGKQFGKDAVGREVLAGDSNVRNMARTLQSTVRSGNFSPKYQTLAQIGITTDAKSGQMIVDDKKLDAALKNDYEGVAEIFTASENGGGLSSRIESALSVFQDPGTGSIKNRIKSLNSNIRRQDTDIERSSQRLEQKKERVQSQVAAMQRSISDAKMQSASLGSLGGASAAASAMPGG